MLPLFRILPVGGVFFAILVLALALKAPGERVLPPVSLTAGGAHGAGNDDPQWRQIAIQAALQRATELMRLRDLPDTPPPSHALPNQASPSQAVPSDAPVIEAPASEPPGSAPQPVVQETAPQAEPPKVAALPTERPDADPDPDSITSSIEDAPAATIPVEIGAASSSELPVVLPEERPAIIRTPERAKPAHESRRKARARVARPKASKPPAPVQRPAQTGLLEDLFSRPRAGMVPVQNATGTQPQPAAQRTNTAR